MYSVQDLSGGYGLYIYRNLNEAGSSALAHFIDDHTAGTQTTVYIKHDGSSGYALECVGTSKFTGVLRVDTGINHNGTTILNSSRELINIAELAINAAAAGTYKLHCNGTANFAGALTGTTATFTGEVDLNFGLDWHDPTSSVYGRLGYGSGFVYVGALGATGILKLFAGGAAAVHILADGKVGIGTTAPDRLLHLYAGASGQATPTTSAMLVLEDDASGNYISFLNPNNATAGFFWGDPQDSARAQLIYSHADNKMTFNAGGAVHMTIQSDGNVGIATAAPAATLDVRRISAAASKWTAAFCSDNQTLATARAHDSVLIQASDVPCLKIYEAASTPQVVTLAVGDGNATLASSNTLRFYVNGSNTGDGYNGLGGTAALNIDTSGNVEITAGQLKPGTNNAQSLGNTARRWNFYANTGDFGGSIYARGGIKDDGGDFGTNGQVLTTNGVDQVNWIDSPGAGSVDGSGTANYVTKWTDGDTVGNSVVYETAAGTIGIHAGTNVEGMVDVQMKMNGVDWTYGNWGEVWDSAGAPGSKFNDCVFHLDTDRGGGVTGGIVGLAFSPGWQGHQNWGIYSTNESGGGYTQGDLRFVNQLNNATITERVTFKADGKVGIGTTSPDTNLHVYTGSSGGSPYNATGLTVENNGRANIHILHPNGSDGYLFFGDANAGNRAYVGHYGSATVTCEPNGIL